MEAGDKRGHHHPLIMLTKTHSGALAKLHTVGEGLDNDLMVTDATGQLRSGVGIRLQKELDTGVYVAGLNPLGPADSSGMIEEVLINT